MNFAFILNNYAIIVFQEVQYPMSDMIIHLVITVFWHAAFVYMTETSAVLWVDYNQGAALLIKQKLGNVGAIVSYSHASLLNA